MEPPSGESPEDSEILEMGKPIERGKEKYVFNGNIKRLCFGYVLKPPFLSTV